MRAHLRANLWLLTLTVVLCPVIYPLVLLGIGQAVFHDKAQGSLITGANGETIGSRLIAQPFGGDEYFHPRPSAAAYNAAASGGSNLAASNYLLRDQVARRLGPIVKYKGMSPSGKSVQEDIKAWFAEQAKTIVAEWADAHPGAAQAWVNADDGHNMAVRKWMQAHGDLKAVKEWVESHAATVEKLKDEAAPSEPTLSDLAAPFFKDNAEKFHASWPTGDSTWTVQAVFFDMWLQQHPKVELEQVPADMVTTSGSGLDPHITLESARYQLDRVVAAWAEKTKRDAGDIRTEIVALLHHSATAPLGGLVGVDLINVLEVNLELREKYGQ